MAEEEKKSGASIFSIPTLLLLSALAGGLFWIPMALVPARPEGARRNLPGSLGSQDVEARLWQDPFEALELAGVPPAEKQETESAPAHPGSTPKSEAYDIQHLSGQIESKYVGWNPIATGTASQPVPLQKQIQVIFAMVAGGPYPEDVESRIRSRVAIMAALGTAGFRSEDEDHVGYVTARWPQRMVREPTGTLWGESWSRLVLPYEWFTRRIHHADSLSAQPQGGHSNHVLVVWLRDNMFADEPLHRLNALIGYLHRQEASDRFKISVIGPRTSTTLREFFSLAEWDHPPVSDDASLARIMRERIGRFSDNWLQGTSLFSPAATTMDGLLVPTGEQCDCRLEVKRRLESLGMKFTNVTCTDDALASALLGELARRDIDIAEPRNHIALISEWDSFYGRTIPMTFAYRLEQMLGDKSPDLLTALRFAKARHGDQIHKFSYLQGIDGRLPGGHGEPAPSNGKSAGEGATSEKKKEPETNRAEGPSQLDYIPRLADHIAGEDRQLLVSRGGWGQPTAIKAIGVLGSDLYDKLLVLQALRPRFPNATFFTTDLDARLWHPAQLKWTRNLVVASSFGLELQQGLQQDIPPFRDSYQTAQYLACLSALGVVPETAMTRLAPRLFEIGRHGAVDLSGPTLLTEKPARLGFFATFAHQYRVAFGPREADPIYPSPRTEISWRWTFHVALFLAISAALTLVLLGRVSPLVRRYVTQRRQTLIREIVIKSEDIRDEALLAEGLRANLPRLNEAVPVTEKFKTALGAMIPGSDEALALDARVTVVDALNEMIRQGDLAALAPEAVSALPLRDEKLQRMAQNRRALEALLPGALFDVSHLLTITWRSLSNFARYAWIVPAVTVALLFIAVMDNQAAASGEPFTWVDGVSAWPSQFIRLLVIVLTVVFLLGGEKDLRRNMVELSRRYLLPYGDDDRRPGGGKRIADWRSIAVGVRAENLWLEYRWLGRQKRRIQRIAFMSIVYFLAIIALASALSSVNAMPTRGVLCSTINFILLMVTVCLTIALNFFVVDATRLCQRFIQNLSTLPTIYPPETLRKFGRGLSLDFDGDLDEWIDMQVIAERSAQVSRLIYYPFITLFLMIVARAHYWDDWAWQPLLVLIFVLNAAWAVSSALVLQRSARQAKNCAVDSVRRKLSELPEAGAEPRAKRFNRILDDIQAMKSGAFAGYTNNPILGALSLPFTGTAITLLLEFVANG